MKEPVLLLIKLIYLHLWCSYCFLCISIGRFKINTIYLFDIITKAFHVHFLLIIILLLLLFLSVAARKDSDTYVEVIIGVLTAIMLLLLIVFVVILILNKRHKLQGSPTLLRNPFSVTINMKVSCKMIFHEVVLVSSHNFTNIICFNNILVGKYKKSLHYQLNDKLISNLLSCKLLTKFFLLLKLNNTLLFISQSIVA